MTTIKGETAENKYVSIPGDTNGKFTILCFASSKKAQHDLETWLDPVYNKYIAKTGLMDDMFDVNVFVIPVFKGANAAIRESIKRKFRETAQQDLWPHVLFCKEGMNEIGASLGLQNDDIPYFFLLDKEGGIIYRTNGNYTDEKFDGMDDKIE